MAHRPYEMSGMEIIKRLREEPFNKRTEERLESHPYLRAAEDGTLTLSQRRAFAREQYSIQLSDATSFAFLAGHRDFAPRSLTGVTVPEQPTKSPAGGSGGGDSASEGVDLFQFLLGGEVHAAPLLLDYARSVGLDEDALRSDSDGSYVPSAKSQAYPSYWARLALSGGRGRAAGAAACAANFPAWGGMCRRLLGALGGGGGYGYDGGVDDAGLAFVKFFATPIEGLDRMAARIIEEEGVPYEELVGSVRLLQEYEVLFWDGIVEK